MRENTWESILSLDYITFQKINHPRAFLRKSVVLTANVVELVGAGRLEDVDGSGLTEIDVLCVMAESVDTEVTVSVVGETVVSWETVGSADAAGSLDDWAVLVVGQSPTTKETIAVDSVTVCVSVSVLVDQTVTLSVTLWVSVWVSHAGGS